MPREHRQRIEEVKQQLLDKIQDATMLPGSRFLSNRAICEQFRVSYQTADTLLRELSQEGWLERRPASGTYIPGVHHVLKGAVLCFSTRGRREGSFGERLLAELQRALEHAGIPFMVQWGDIEPKADFFPVIWELPVVREHCKSVKRRALVLNERPQPGLDALVLDSISIDDRLGGICAAELVIRKMGRDHTVAIVGGPHGDPRSRSRVEGFQSILPGSITDVGWFAEEGERVAESILQQKASCVFCANDRLAEGFWRIACHSEFAPRVLVGFDNAPIAVATGLSTIAIPWKEVADRAVATIRNRLTDERSTSVHQILAPRPIWRSPLPRAITPRTNGVGILSQSFPATNPIKSS